MKLTLQRSIALTCIVLLVIASIAIAEDVEDSRRGPQGGRGRNQQGGGETRGRGGPGMMGGGGMGQGMGGRGGPGMMGGPGMRGGGGPGMGMGSGQKEGLIPEMIRQRLNLTKEQTDKLDGIQQRQMKGNMDLSQKQDKLRDELEAAVNKGDKEAIVKIAQEIGKAIGDTALLRLSGKESLKGILDETQLERIEKYNLQRQESRDKMREMMQQRMGGEGGRPPARQRGNEGRMQERGSRPEERQMSERQRQRLERQERQKKQQGGF